MDVWSGDTLVGITNLIKEEIGLCRHMFIQLVRQFLQLENR